MADPIQYQSALPALLTQLLGTTSKSGGGTTTSSGSSTSTANTDPLMQIFGQQMGTSTPAGMQALLGELFSQGAQQVPVLTDAYANARGARSSGNSGLALAIAELNKGLTGQAATLLGDQQAKTSNTAAAIANASRGTSETRTQVNPATTTTTGNPKAAAGLGAAGFALNAADKMGLLKGLKGSVGNMFTGTPGAGAMPLDANSLTMNYDSYDLQGGAGLQPFAASPMDMSGGFAPDTGSANFPTLGSFDMFGGGGGFDPSMYDLSGFGGDFANGFASSGGVLDEAALGGAGFENYDAYDLQGGTDWFSDAASSVGDFFGGWFADGGVIRPQYPTASFNHRMKVAPPMPTVRTVPNNSYADGGMVRNKNYMGGPLSRGMGSGAVNYAPRPMQQESAPGSTMSNSSQGGGSMTSGMLLSQPALLERILQDNARRAVTLDTTGGGGDSTASTSDGTVGSVASNSAAVGGMAMSALGMFAPMAAMALGMMTNTPSMQTQAVQALAQAIGIGGGGGGGPGGPGDNDGGNAAANAASPSNSPAATGMDAQAAENAANAAMGADASAGSSGASAGGGPGGGDTDAGSSGAGAGPGADAGGGPGSGGDGTGSGGDAAGDGGSWADGGYLKGPGTGISDSIDIKAANGEFIFSKDVVDMLGVDLLQQIQDKLHTPAAVQKAAGAR